MNGHPAPRSSKIHARALLVALLSYPPRHLRACPVRQPRPALQRHRPRRHSRSRSRRLHRLLPEAWLRTSLRPPQRRYPLRVLHQDQRQPVHRALPGNPQGPRRRASSTCASKASISTPSTTTTSATALPPQPSARPAPATCSSPWPAHYSRPARKTSSTPSTCPAPSTPTIRANTSAPTASPLS